MRISREQMYMSIAHVLSRRSTCFRNNVGAVIDYTGGWRINGTGYNGPPSGDPHCQGNECAFDGVCLRSIHAETNAISRMEYMGPLASWLFTTRSPCLDCTIGICNSKVINRVYFDEAYRDIAPIRMLLDAKIEVFRLTPSGYIVNMETSQVINADTQ